jgi:hypothetical protein
MSTESMIPMLAGFTLLAALLFGGYQLWRVRRAQRLHEPAVPGETTKGGIVRDPEPATRR